MNGMIGEKISIMSDRPQTTRNKIMGILSANHAQIMFLDTPGIHKPMHKLGEYMNQAAIGALNQVDVILFVVDACEKKGAGEKFIIEHLKKIHTPVLLVVNKIDKLDDKSKLLGIINGYKDDLAYSAIIPVSALQQEGFAELQEEIVRHLPEGPSLFPEDELTDQPMRVIAAEMIREKALRNTHDEVPHAIAVEIDEFKERTNGNIFIRATIFVERESQKGIVIGANGNLLKKIGQEARQDIENLTGCGVFLDLWVKVQSDWRNKSKMLKEFGYKEP
jgi:GTP-binding protein Era